MPRFSANLSMLFTELPFRDRFQAAAEAGFSAVEFLFPYECEPQDLVQLIERASVEVVLHNLPAGDWAAGERGIACDPTRVEEFRSGVRLAIKYAQALRCPQLNCLAGIRPAALEPAVARLTLVENLAFAAAQLRDAGLGLLLEPVNTRDIPGFFVSQTRQALELIEEVNAPNLKLQYDVYHAQVMEGDLVRTLEKHLPKIGHIQVADNPGRNEPGTGEINFPFLFRRLDAIGYRGWVGCEYRPLATTLGGLNWLEDYPQAPHPSGFNEGSVK